MNVNIYNIEDYQNFIPLAGYKNKPKTNPILSALGGFRKAKMNLKSLAIKSGHTPLNMQLRKNLRFPGL